MTQTEQFVSMLKKESDSLSQIYQAMGEIIDSADLALGQASRRYNNILSMAEAYGVSNHLNKINCYVEIKPSYILSHIQNNLTAARKGQP